MPKATGKAVHDFARERLARQFLTTAGPRSASGVVRALGAVQAQDYAGARWALSMRAGDPTEADVEGEIAAGKILRTHILRPTWHFVAPEDIRWMLALTGPRVAASMASYNRKLELTPAVFRRSHAAITRALADGQHLTRAELAVVLSKARVGDVKGQRLAHMMMQAEADAVVCSGCRRGKQFTYALLDTFAPPSPAIARDEALARLARIYFRTRGPASAHDFAWWSGLPIADSRRAVEMLGAEAISVRSGERMLFVVGNTPQPAAKQSAHLLPNYDEYFIGLRDRSAIGGRARSVELVTGGDGLINHIAVIDGEIVGGWKRVLTSDKTVVALKLIVKTSAAERALLDREVERFSRFLEMPVVLEVTQRRVARVP